ncbi:MAG: hypothetical protein ACHQC8_00665 [Solirubrobacterales bacterium]
MLLTSGVLAVGLTASGTASAKPQRRIAAAIDAGTLASPLANSSPLLAAGPGEGVTAAPPAQEEASTRPRRSAQARPQRVGSCHASIEATSPRITSGETVTVFGALRCAGGAIAAGRAVTVYQSQRGTYPAGSSEVGTTTTEADGSYKLTPAAFNVNTLFYVRSAGAHGAHTVVKVAPKVTFEGPAAGTQLLTRGEHLPAQAHNRMTFTGTVSPADSGALVALQREYAATGEQWRPIAFGRVGLDGRYSITHGFSSPGMASVRVVVHPTGPNLVAASEPLSYEIAQAQNPKLTIQTTADPISYGQAVKITGVATGSAQPVTLLARTAGTGFVEVAHQTTDASGNYDFEESPLRSTSYRVTDSSTMSTELFEGVKYALVTGTVPETAQTGQQLTFSGTLAPAHVGQVVLLEREGSSGINFHVVETATVSADSSYSIAYTFHHVCTCVMRVKVPAGSENQASTGEPFSVRVTPALATGPEPEEPSVPVSVEK